MPGRRRPSSSTCSRMVLLVVARRGLEVGRIRRHPVHPGRCEPGGIDEGGLRPAVVAAVVGGGHGPLVHPEDVHLRPVEPRLACEEHVGVARRVPAGEGDRGAPVLADGVAQNACHAGGRFASDLIGIARGDELSGDDFGGHGARVRKLSPSQAHANSSPPSSSAQAAESASAASCVGRCSVRSSSVAVAQGSSRTCCSIRRGSPPAGVASSRQVTASSPASRSTVPRIVTPPAAASRRTASRAFLATRVDGSPQQGRVHLAPVGPQEPQLARERRPPSTRGASPATRAAAPPRDPAARRAPTPGRA